MYGNINALYSHHTRNEKMKLEQER